MGLLALRCLPVWQVRKLIRFWNTGIFLSGILAFCFGGIETWYMYEPLWQMCFPQALDLDYITMPGQVRGMLRACLLVLCGGQQGKYSTALLSAFRPGGCPFSRRGEPISQQDSRDQTACV